MDDIPNIPTDSDDDARYRSPEYQSELMNFLSQSSEMRKTAKGALKQSLFSAGGAFVGAFVAGPVGGLVGGIAGSVAGFIQGDNYDGAIIAITRLESDRKRVRHFEVDHGFSFCNVLLETDQLIILFSF
jgi:hypothetical protein